VVTVCEAFARLIEKRGVARERIRVEYMPIRPSTERPPRARQTLRSHLQIEAGTIVLLSVGRLSKEKGHAELVRAVARIHRTEPALPIRLLLVGDGPEAAPLKALCRELKIESRVLFAGHQATVRDYYAAADIFVLPSHSEGSPNVLLEAIDADLPIVATAVGGISEMVGNEVEALLVRRGDGEALAGAITRLVHDEALRERLKSAGRKLLDRHTPEKFFRNLATIFREVADSGP
jgi:glycosyltransferase involved in cell wall biosynthesis